MPLLSADGEEISADINSFVELVNRGGLLMPNALAFAVGIKCWTIFGVIKESSDLQRMFLDSGSQKKLFTAVTMALLDDDCDINEPTVNQNCAVGHECMHDMVGRLFGSIAKIFVRSLSVPYSLLSAADSRKIAKLTSSKQKM